jgi:hypothetical protein
VETAVEHLSSREKAKLEAVLNRTCRSMPHGGDHDLRKQVAQKLFESALKGQSTRHELRCIARAAFLHAIQGYPVALERVKD